MQQLPFFEYQQPVISYMFWRMQSGDTPDQALERAQLQAKFTGFTNRDWVRMQFAAQANLAATRALRGASTLTPDAPLINIVGGGDVDVPAFYGVRVTIMYQQGDRMVGRASMLVNARPGTRLSDLLEQAMGFFNERLGGSQQSGPIRGVEYSADISQYQPYAWDNAAFTM